MAPTPTEVCRDLLVMIRSLMIKIPKFVDFFLKWFKVLKTSTDFGNLTFLTDFFQIFFIFNCFFTFFTFFPHFFTFFPFFSFRHTSFLPALRLASSPTKKSAHWNCRPPRTTYPTSRESWGWTPKSRRKPTPFQLALPGKKRPIGNETWRSKPSICTRTLTMPDIPLFPNEPLWRNRRGVWNVRMPHARKVALHKLTSKRL